MWIGSTRPPDRTSIETVFSRHAPWARLCWDSELSEQSRAGDIVIEVRTHPSEFAFIVDTIILKDCDAYELGLLIARDLSIALACSTICDGTRHGPTRAPFWCVVWTEGAAFLGDDCESLFAEYYEGCSQEEMQAWGPVKRVRPIDI